MSNKIGQLNRAKTLLSQALNTAMASMPNNRSVVEAGNHIRSAIRKIDGAAKTQLQRRHMSQTQFETWWGNIQSGVANQPMSAEARQKNLAQLNGMIGKEQSKIDELEAKITEDIPDQLLED